ncbi:MAG: hypothetical protein ABJH98_15150 [Reichenbachiella sp.]|uniref:hypothetical protein n=1 Tax=Reichenbachiella sp. TaxID=2184521 RepID=UPI003298155A
MNKSLSLTIVYDWECPLSEFSFFDVNSGNPYFSADEADLFLSKYRSGIDKQLKEIIDANLPLSIYFSGSFLEQLANCDADIIKSLKTAKHIELLGGTYHHSLVSLFSKSHFQREINWHQSLIKKLFGQKPSAFLNTTNIYFNDLTEQLTKEGYQSTFAGAIDWYLGDNKNQRIFSSRTNEDFKLMLTNQDRGHTLFHDHEVVNHFMQLSSQQLDEFGGWKALTQKVKNKADLVSLSEQLRGTSLETYNVRQPISCSYELIELDGLKNYPLQESWLKQLYGLETSIAKKPEPLQKKWSRLGSIGVLKKLNSDIDHSDSNNSYDTYQSLINILSDLHLRL